MKISEILKDDKYHLSCELFPPKSGTELKNAVKLVEEIVLLDPSYISVTYGAAGTDVGQSLEVADAIQKHGKPALSHLTCIGAKRDLVKDILAKLRAQKVENILALRGDLFDGVDVGDFHHANELVEFIKQNGDFCIGGAAYPQGHPESASLNWDIENVKRKVDAGAEFLVTQMFFYNDMFYNYALRLIQEGINVPVVPGIISLTNAAQVRRICKLSGADLPTRIKTFVDRFGDDPESMKQAGIAFATAQIADLFANGFKNVHIFTMNKPEIYATIKHNLASLFK